MKEYISPQDLKSLTVAQKELFRSLWKPEINQLAVASICTNVETDEYEDIEFVIGQILINDSGQFPRFMLRRLRLMDHQPEEEENQAPDDYIEDEFFDDPDEEDGEDFDVLYIEPEEFFNLEDCLPLLSIGQLTEYIRRSRFGQRGFKLIIPPVESKLFEQKLFQLEDSDGEIYENQEFCDLLWNIFKTHVLGVI